MAASPLAAQNAPPTITAEQTIAAAQEAYGPPQLRPKADCPSPTSSGEIVVCAQTEDQSKYRVQSTGDLDPTGAGARDSVPRAPSMEKPKCVPSLLSMCAGLGPPLGRALIIDLKAIPDAPPDSDAELIGKGERPQ